MKAGARWFIVVVLIGAWIAISNHCVLAAIATESKSSQSECPFHSKPAKPQPAPSATECCKILRALVPIVSKSWTRDDASFSDVDFEIDQFIIFPDSHPISPLLLDTGPPGKTSFAELILQQSLLAHAPPARV